MTHNTEFNPRGQVLLSPTRSSTFHNFEYSVHVAPKSMRYELVDVFPEGIINKRSPILVIPTFQRSSVDLLQYGDEQAAEKDRLLERFFDWSEKVFQAVKQVEPNAWIDATDPASGMAWKGLSGSPYSDVDGIVRLLRYDTLDVGGCRVTSHPQWGFSVYPATLFSTVSERVIIDALNFVN